jgi:glycosyltransferase involved in cell wall biosynthesis
MTADSETVRAPDHKLSVLIPVYNERETILQILDRVRGAPAAIEKEMIVVDDASSDGTADLLRSVDEGDVAVYFHERNKGKGAAVRTGLRHATGDIILVQDADLEYDPEDYPALLRPILDGRADAVLGTRFAGGEHRVLYYRHYLGNRLITMLSNLLTNLNLSDVEAGYKVFKASVLEGIEIESDRFGLEPELVAKVAKRHCRIYEVPISYRGRTYAEGKKITWKDGLAAVWWVVKYNLFR